MATDTSYTSYYVLGAIFMLLGIALILVPILARSGVLSSARIPWIILYVYNRGGFYFATSPLLLIVSLLSLLITFIRR